jgi:hypothetical protein
MRLLALWIIVRRSVNVWRYRATSRIYFAVQQVAGKQTDVLERKGNKCRGQILNREKLHSVDECARLEKKGTTLGDAFFCSIAVQGPFIRRSEAGTWVHEI